MKVANKFLVTFFLSFVTGYVHCVDTTRHVLLPASSVGFKGRHKSVDDTVQVVQVRILFNVNNDQPTFRFNFSSTSLGFPSHSLS
jgi:hypothetical protein